MSETTKPIKVNKAGKARRIPIIIDGCAPMSYVARKVGITRQTMYSYIAKGYVPARKINAQWYVPLDAVKFAE